MFFGLNKESMLWTSFPRTKQAFAYPIPRHFCHFYYPSSCAADNSQRKFKIHFLINL